MILEKAAVLSGYLFESNIRFASKCAPWFGFPIIGLFGVLLWVETIKCFFSLPLLLLAFLWSCLCVWLVWSYNYTRKIDSIKYSCIQNKVINQLQDGKRTVYLDNTVFAALLKAEFAYGKSTQNKEFYIISNSPISLCTIGDKHGLFLFKKLYQQGIVAIPKSTSTQAWLLEALNIIQISEYPRITCRTRGHRTGDGSLS